MLQLYNDSNVLLHSSVVSWKTFFVLLSGKTNRAHHDFVEKLKDVGHTEVDSPEECDYLLVFCPVASRVGTDIKDAMNKMTGNIRFLTSLTLAG